MTELDLIRCCHLHTGNTVAGIEVGVNVVNTMITMLVMIR
jgi:hypothetical protein